MWVRYFHGIRARPHSEHANAESATDFAAGGPRASSSQGDALAHAPDSGELYILGFQLYIYRSNVQTEIDSDVGKGEDETDSKFAYFENCMASIVDPGILQEMENQLMHSIGLVRSMILVTCKRECNSETDAQFVKDLEELLKDETLDPTVRLKVKAAKLHFERVTVVYGIQRNHDCYTRLDWIDCSCCKRNKN